MAQARGVAVDGGVLKAVEDRTFREFSDPGAIDAAIQGVNVVDPPANDSYLLMAAGAAGRARDLQVEIYARRILSWQRDDHWETSDFRPPHSSSIHTATATAIRAMRLYLPPELRREGDAAIRRASGWLARTSPESTEDAAFRLFGQVWADASADVRGEARHTLTAMQRRDGGWGQLPGYPSDAYSTGEALVALQQAGVSASDPDWRRGISFLLSTQARDGTWRVRTRMISPATVSPPYFHVDFPYGKDAFLSYAGSAWATMALLSALPMPSPAAPPPTSAVTTASRPAWLRTTLFGSPDDLMRLLDGGLKSDTATEGGTTLLMAAAADAGKVALLLSRGADATTRAPSGVDALTTAATYRGTALSIALLLDKGAAAMPPADVRVRHTPLAYVAMSGDIETTGLLLASGVKASEDALSESVTFGNAMVTKSLLDAGANAQISERSGITLLHWAVITNRPAAIPLLVAAGAAIDAKDDVGFTPLMYAATIDVGNTRLVSALLQAGANRQLRNADGRTPRQQALHLGHRQIAEALK
jgi:ankyrin repeat protein